MEIIDKLYSYFCYDKIDFVDVAKFNCNNKNEYSSSLYRILATDNNLDKISIYKKFKFNYSYDCDEHDLIYIRSFNINDFYDFLNELDLSKSIYYDSIKKLLLDKITFLTSDTSSEKINNVHELFKSLKTNTDLNCNENFIFFTFMYKLSQMQLMDRDLYIQIKNKNNINHINFIEKLYKLIDCQYFR
jgi:hypothetical protein